MKRVRLLIIGAGSRGNAYAKYVLANPDRAEIVGVSEPRESYRNRFAVEYSIPNERVFSDWKEAAAAERFADGVVIATPDALHVEPAIAFAEMGYDILLEKPMAPTEAECRSIVQAAIDNDVLLAVCHVRRYTTYTRKLKEIIDSGAIGDVISIQLLEPVGYWHQAHSYVRGNWRNESESSPMLLAKSCHDLDWLRYLIGSRCMSVSSFGNLMHFRKENRPEGAADRCVDCDIEAQCPYSAKKVYLGNVQEQAIRPSVDILTPDHSRDGVTKALREGPYGRCVYSCDNDVVDHQVVNLLFDGGQTASFTMTGFTEPVGRQIRIFGTLGQLTGNDVVIRHYNFLTDTTTEIDTQSQPGITSGHGGGDFGVMNSFVTALATGNRNGILSGPLETLETHQMVFAAEQARRQQAVVKLSQFKQVCRQQDEKCS